MSETESNDSAATADVLSSGQEIKGQLSSSSDRDVFSITTTSAGTLKIDLDTPTYSTGNYFSVILWDGYNTIASQSTGQDTSFSAGVEAGTYTVWIDSSTYYDAGEYGLTVTSTAGNLSGVETESNDSAATADVLSSGQEIKGQLSSSSDRDVFSITTTSAGTLKIDLDTPTYSTGNYFSVILWDGYNTIASQSTGQDTSFSAGVEAGTYTVWIDSSTYYDAGEYGLTVTSTAGNLSGVETESNDSAATADVLSSGQEIKGQLSSSSDRDVFSITTTSAGTLKIDLDTPTYSTGNYFSVILWDGYNTIASQSTGQDTSFSAGVEAGTYTVWIDSSTYYDAGEYGLTVTSTAGNLSGVETESNDSAATADVLSSGQEIKGQLSSSSDRDVFSITTTSAGTLKIDLDTPTYSTGNYFSVILWDGYNTIASQSTGQDTSFSAGVEAGTYTVWIDSSTYYDAGEYGLTVTSTAGNLSGVETESNDSAATADVLSSGQEIKGQLSSSSDRDVFSITTTSASTLKIDLDTPTYSTGNYFSVILWDGYNTIASQSTGQDTSFSAGVEAGTYTVWIDSSTYYDAGEYGLTVTSTAGNLSGVETESNDSAATADVLSSGQEIKGQLSSSSDRDVFSITTTSAGTLKIDLDTPTYSTGNYFSVILWDGYNTIASQSTGQDTSFSAGVEAGTYTVWIDSSTYYDAGEYGLTVTSTAGNLSGVETESNDSAATADVLSSGQEIKGQLSSSSDRDVFSITTTSAGTLKIDLDTPTYSTGNYFSVILWDGYNTIASQSTGQDTSFSAGVEAGTYTVWVDSSTYYDAGEYGLTVTSTAGNLSGVETESNDSAATADVLSSGQEIKGQLSSSSDRDVFSITTTSAGTLKIDLDTPTYSTGNYFSVILWDGYNTIASQSTGQDTSFSAGVEAGTYTVWVDSSTYYDAGEYGLTVTSTAGNLSGVETESNDSFVTADKLIAGSKITGQLMSDQDWDVFSINIENSGEASLEFDTPTNSLSDYFFVGIYNDQYDLIDYKHSGNDISFSTGYISSGTYYVGVHSSTYYNSDDYSLVVNLSSSANYHNETEDNGTFNSADKLQLGTEIKGQLASTTDWDVFSFTLGAPGVVTAAFESPTDSNSDYFFVGLYNSDFEILAANYTGKDLSFNAGADTAGVYYAAVYTGTNYTSAQYGLTITSQAGSLFEVETETNDSFQSADVLKLDTNIKGQLLSAEDWDVFKLNIDSVGTLSVSFDAPTNSYNDYFFVGVYDSNFERLSADQSGKDFSFNSAISSGGTYYAAVHSSDYFNGGEYSLSTSFETSQDNEDQDSFIYGTKNSEVLNGTSSDDKFSYLGGNDIIYAGLGDDSFTINGAASSEFQIKAINNLTSISSFNSSTYGNVKIRALDIEKVSWAGNELATNNSSTTSFDKSSLIFGSTLNDTLIGTSQNDVFDGLGGSDTINGGEGQDTLLLFESTNQVQLSGIEGIYRISSHDDQSEYYSSVSKVYNVEKLTLSDKDISLTVKSVSNLQIFKGENNSISGTQQDDFIDGGGGSDIIDGKLGQDTAIFFSSINDAKISVDQQTGITTVVFKEVDQAEYAFSTTQLKSIEKIKFVDGDFDVVREDLYSLSTSGTEMTEGGAGLTVEITLNSKPSSIVNVNLSSDNINFDTSDLSFSETNWNQPQSVTLTVTDNQTYDGTNDYPVSITLKSEDANFNIEERDKFKIKVKDDEEPDVNNFIQGRIWEDNDKDGELDTNESGISNLKIYLDLNNNHVFDSGDKHTLTDISGNYSFNDLDLGTYSVGIADDYGWQYTFPSKSSASASATSLSETVEDLSTDASTYFQDVSNNKFSLRPDLKQQYSSLDGTGQTVVIIDSGIDTDHSYFGSDANNDGVSDQIIFSKTFGSGKANGEDVGGHGTHVAGIIASSDGQFTGVAPGADIIALKVFDSDGAGKLEKALNWCIENAEKYSIDAINLSLGFPLDFFTTDKSYWLDDYGLGDEFTALNDLGVVCVAAAGNSYDGVWSQGYGYVDYFVNYGLGREDYYTIPAGTHSIQGISAPAAYPEVISVGAAWGGPDLQYWGSYNANNGDPNAGSIVHFSQRDDELLDLVAFGGGITSAKMGGGDTAMSGTSMSAPYVSGLVLLMQQLAEQELGRKLTPAEVKTIINTQSDKNFDGDDENYSVQETTNVSYNDASINNWLDYIKTLKNPLFHSVDLNSSTSEHDFGLVSSKINSFTNESEQIVVSAAGAETNAAGGSDYIIGSSGNDTIYGGDGDDVVGAAGGDDIIIGGKGDDRLSGGDGSDTFRYNKGDGNDTITDWDAINDTIEYLGFSDSEKIKFKETIISASENLITLSDGSTINLQAVNNETTGTLFITGDAIKGSVLTVQTSAIADADGLGTFTYQWIREGILISSETDSSYFLTDADVGNSISVKVSYTDAKGTSESVMSYETVEIEDVVTQAVGAISVVNSGASSAPVLDFYLDSSKDPGDAGVSSVDVALKFDPTQASFTSFSYANGFVGSVNEASAADGTITFGAIALTPVSTDKPLFTMTMADLDSANDFSVTVSDLNVDGSALEGSTLVVGSSASHTVTTSVVTRDGSKIADAGVVMSDDTNSSSYKSTADGSVSGSLTSGSASTVTGSLAYSNSTKAISSQDALDALKLSVGMTTAAGTKTAFDFISADFNQDGKVSSQDALSILKYSVGLTTPEQAEWVFVDTGGDYSGVSKSNTSYTEGVSIAELSADISVSLTGILIGDVNDSYSGLIA